MVQYSMSANTPCCRSYTREVSIPKELAQRIAKLETDAYVAWVGARKESRLFKALHHSCSNGLMSSQQKAAAIDPSKPVYDVLLDDFEKGMTAAQT